MYPRADIEHGTHAFQVGTDVSLRKHHCFSRAVVPLVNRRIVIASGSIGASKSAIASAKSRRPSLSKSQK